MSIKENIARIEQEIAGKSRLIAVTKTLPVEVLQETYDAGFKVFGENKVQELVAKYELLPKDIEWHLIGHLQTNKVKYITSFVTMIHSVDSFKLLAEINKQAAKSERAIDCLLQIYIANEETKFGLSFEEATALISSEELKKLSNIRIVGLMGMATNTEEDNQIRAEFRSLKVFFESCKSLENERVVMRELSMGMSGDYLMATEEGSTLVRVGSAIFGNRNYN
jgi:pyridoxal phosphate enzyme (YggS family)